MDTQNITVKSVAELLSEPSSPRTWATQLEQALQYRDNPSRIGSAYWRAEYGLAMLRLKVELAGAGKDCEQTWHIGDYDVTFSTSIVKRG